MDGEGLAVCVGRPGRVRSSFEDLHRVVRKGIVLRQRDSPADLLLVLTVRQPVVDHELKPCRGEHVEDGRGDELVASEELAADSSRIGRENRPLVDERVPVGHVAAETRVGAPHRRHVEVVVCAVRAAAGHGALRRWGLFMGEGWIVARVRLVYVAIWSEQTPRPTISSKSGSLARTHYLLAAVVVTSAQIC